MIERVNLTNPIRGTQTGAQSPNGATRPGSFAATLARETERQQSLKISSHAQKRLNSSQVTLSDQDMQRIDGAVNRAGEKGSNQSLIMLDNLALVVSVKNRVVITAVDEARQSEGVFTNIDSVVIA
jgi:flagellar operon protein